MSISERKSWTTALLLSVCGGVLGLDRFYLGYLGLGVAKLLTVGGGLVWWVLDVVAIFTGRMTDAEGRPLQK